MRPLNSRHPGRFTPKVEPLEERSLLSATLAGAGKILTTAAVNHVLITDDGTAVKVISENGLVATFLEGTAVSVGAKVKGSTNFVEYDLLGSALPNAAAAVTLLSTLTVNFGTGNGQLLSQVVTTLPVVFGGPTGLDSNLGRNSSVKITANSTKGNTQDYLFCGDLGTGANLSDVDTGGKGNHAYSARLTGTEFNAASLNLKFTGGDGTNLALVTDQQDISQAASATVDLRSKGKLTNQNSLGVFYVGTLKGSLNVTADAGPGTNNLIGLGFTLRTGSTGRLTSTAKTGPGAANVRDVVTKAPADTPFVNETATGIGSGLKQGFFTTGNTATSVAVIFSGFSTVTVVPGPPIV